MNTNGCFIGIDQGSSATKAVVVGWDGSVLYRTKRELSAPFREGLRVEQDPAEIIRSVREVLDETAIHTRDSGLDLIGAGLSCQRSSCLAWDQTSGQPLSPVLSWRDRRGAATVEALTARKERVFNLSGMPLTPYYSATKFGWILESVPASRQAAAVFGTLSSFLTQRLTGSDHALIDHTNAARTQLMDIGSMDWSGELRDIFRLGDIRLPKIVPTVNDFGLMKTSAGPVALLACIGDQQAALLGLGVTGAAEGGINYGTGGFVLVNTGMTLKRAPGLISSVHYSTGSGPHYLLEGSVNAAGDALEWLRSRFGLFRGFDDVDDLCWKATEDVVAFLGLNGTGAPHWENSISSALHGLTAGSNAADVVRASIECIAFFVQDIADAMRASGISPELFIASGGLSSFSYLVQVQADLLGKNVSVSHSSDASAQGAAFLAGLGRGAWTAEDIGRMTRREEPAIPRANQGLFRRRRRWTALHQAVLALDRIS